MSEKVVLLFEERWFFLSFEFLHFQVVLGVKSLIRRFSIWFVQGRSGILGEVLWT